MNGRMYDPALGRMLTPDNYVQAPDFTQNYNRYSYVLNSPLRYVDPSGEKVEDWYHGSVIKFFLTAIVDVEIKKDKFRIRLLGSRDDFALLTFSYNRKSNSGTVAVGYVAFTLAWQGGSGSGTFFFIPFNWNNEREVKGTADGGGMRSEYNSSEIEKSVIFDVYPVNAFGGCSELCWACSLQVTTGVDADHWEKELGSVKYSTVNEQLGSLSGISEVKMNVGTYASAEILQSNRGDAIFTLYEYKLDPSTGNYEGHALSLFRVDFYKDGTVKYDLYNTGGSGHIYGTEDELKQWYGEFKVFTFFYNR